VSGIEPAQDIAPNYNDEPLFYKEEGSLFVTCINQSSISNFVTQFD